MADIIYKQGSFAIVGACFEVYNEKGCGFLEPVYQECLQTEFDYQRIPCHSEAGTDPQLSRPHPAANDISRTSSASARSS